MSRTLAEVVREALGPRSRSYYLLKRALWGPYQLVRNVLDARLFQYRFHRRRDALRVAPAWTVGEAADDSAIVDRVVRAYQRHGARLNTEGGSQWDGIADQFHRDLRDAIVANQRPVIARALRDPASSNLFYGFDNLNRLLLTGRRLEDRYAPAQALDGLIRVAEAVGALRLENPEDYRYRLPRLVGADEAIDLLEQAFGFALAVPNPFPREYGARTKRGVVTYRVPQAIYQAWRTRELVGHLARPRVLEIGGGLGRAALYCRQFGIVDYTILDIPMSSLAQGYFLGRVLGPDAVTLYGEAAPDDRPRIRLLPPEAFLGATDRYDLVVNVDGLTEYDEASVRDYWRAIQQRADTLLSINHESNPLTVRQLIADSGAAARATRTPSWMRRGYVEEVLRFS